MGDRHRPIPGGWGLILTGVRPGVGSAEGESRKGGAMAVLRFGTFLAPNMHSTYEAIAHYVAARIGMEAELAVETDYESCVADVHDVCFVCSLPYVIFEREGRAPSSPVAAPVLSGERYAGRPIYFSDVIVRRDDPATTFLDLRGRRWAFNEPMSQSGYGITRYHMVMLGETGGFFSEVIEAGYHDTAIEMVRAGRVDASAIDSQVLAVAHRLDPSLAGDVRTIEALGPSTIQPVAVTHRFSQPMREAIQEALVDAGSDPAMREAMRHGVMDRIVPVGPDHYEDIRMMLNTCERAGFMEIR